MSWRSFFNNDWLKPAGAGTFTWCRLLSIKRSVIQQQLQWWRPPTFRCSGPHRRRAESRPWKTENGEGRQQTEGRGMHGWRSSHLFMVTTASMQRLSCTGWSSLRIICNTKTSYECWETITTSHPSISHNFLSVTLLTANSKVFVFNFNGKSSEKYFLLFDSKTSLTTAARKKAASIWKLWLYSHNLTYRQR